MAYGTRSERAAQALKGHYHTEQTKQKISVANSKKVFCVELNKSYPSVCKASKDLNICAGSIYNCCHGSIKTGGGYH